MARVDRERRFHPSTCLSGPNWASTSRRHLGCGVLRPPSWRCQEAARAGLHGKALLAGCGGSRSNAFSFDSRNAAVCGCSSSWPTSLSQRMAGLRCWQSWATKVTKPPRRSRACSQETSRQEVPMSFSMPKTPARHGLVVTGLENQPGVSSSRGPAGLGRQGEQCMFLTAWCIGYALRWVLIGLG